MNPTLTKPDQIRRLLDRAELLSKLPDHDECKALRVEAGWTLAHMAQRCKVSPHTVSRWERGGSWPGDPGTLKRYAHSITHLRISRQICEALAYIAELPEADRPRYLAVVEEYHATTYSAREWEAWKAELGWPT